MQICSEPAPNGKRPASHLKADRTGIPSDSFHLFSLLAVAIRRLGRLLLAHKVRRNSSERQCLTLIRMGAPRAPVGETTFSPSSNMPSFAGEYAMHKAYGNRILILSLISFLVLSCFVQYSRLSLCNRSPKFIHRFHNGPSQKSRAQAHKLVIALATGPACGVLSARSGGSLPKLYYNPCTMVLLLLALLPGLVQHVSSITTTLSKNPQASSQASLPPF